MDYRTKTHGSVIDSDSSGSDDDLPLFTGTESVDIAEQADECPPAKKAASLWGDTLVEQSLLQKGSRISLEKKNSDNRVVRGVESYHIPTNFVRVDKEDFESYNLSAERNAATASTDDPFDDAPIDLSCETAFCERFSEDNTHSHGRDLVRNALRKKDAHFNSHPSTSRGRGPQGRCRGSERGRVMNRGRGGGFKRSWQGKVIDPNQLLSSSYSLETLMAVEFSSDISVEHLGDEIAKAMGERDPKTVKSIVRVCGVDKAIALFEETRKVESTGGMMIENGQRRRTPGGVFISLFKLDSDISEDVKKQLFGETKHEARKMMRARKKGHSKFAADVAKLAELMKKEKEKNVGDGFESLKPLPSVEEVALQKQNADSMADLENDEILDTEMES